MLGKLGTSACAFPLDVFSITWQPRQSLPASSLPAATSGIVDSTWLGCTPSSGSCAVVIADVSTRNTAMIRYTRADEMKRGQTAELQFLVTSFSVELGEVTFAITPSGKTTYTTLGA